MASFFIVDKQCFDSYTGITATPIGAYGDEVEGMEIYNAMNSQRADYCPIYGFAQQPIDFLASGGFRPPDTIVEPIAVYLKFEYSVTEVLNVSANEVNLYTGPAGSVTIATGVEVYGDGKGNSGGGLYYDIALTEGYAESVMLFDDQYTDEQFTVQLETSEVDVATYGDEYKLYEIMIGISVALPDTHQRQERTTSRQFYSGSQSINPFGNPMWSGMFSQTPRKKFDLTWEGLTQSRRDLIFDVFKYSRGVYPVMYIQDSSDKTTWCKCLLTGMQETEDALAFNVVLNAEEM